MYTQFRKTIVIIGMVLVLMCSTCLAACPNAAGQGTGSSDSGCAGSTCTDGSCSSCSGSAGYSPDVYGAFKCESGDCVTKVCESGSCDTNTLTDTGAGNATGVAACIDGTCKAKVCDGTTCETGTISTDGGPGIIASWFDSLFGDSSEPEVEEVASTCESDTGEEVSEATPVDTYEFVGNAPAKETTNYYGNFASNCNATPVEEVAPVCETETVVPTCETEEGCATYAQVYDALRADTTEKNIFNAESYNSMDFADDVCAGMTAKEIDCTIVKVTFTDGSVSYFNSFKTCDGELKVDSCGTTNGSGIKKVINTLEVGKQWTATSLFKECPKTYTRGIVESIEYLE